MGRLTRGAQLGVVVAGMALTLGMAAWGGRAGGPDSTAPHVSALTPEAAGRYLVVAGGCNDCHTQGWAETNGQIPESEWLLGAPVGFKGPWGTSYPKNLRRVIASMSEDAFVTRMKTAGGLPPMPYMNVARLDESDIRAIYRYIASLGVAGEVMPASVAPGVEPSTPYIVFEPVMPKAAMR